MSILDLNADINLAIDAAAPIDLAVAANANVAAPIDAAVGANVLSVDSTAQALSDQGVLINQGLDADATAHAVQDSALDQGTDTAAAGPAAADRGPGRLGRQPGRPGPPAPWTPALSGVRSTAPPVQSTAPPAAWTPALSAVRPTAPPVRSTARRAPSAARWAAPRPATCSTATCSTWTSTWTRNADIAAPINGAVAANANVAAPIDAAVGANVGSVGSDAVAVSQQDAIINQDIAGSADADVRPAVRHHPVARDRDDGPRRLRDGTRRRLCVVASCRECARRPAPCRRRPAHRRDAGAPATASRPRWPGAATARRSS